MYYEKHSVSAGKCTCLVPALVTILVRPSFVGNWTNLRTLSAAAGNCVKNVKNPQLRFGETVHCLQDFKAKGEPLKEKANRRQ